MDFADILAQWEARTGALVAADYPSFKEPPQQQPPGKSSLPGKSPPGTPARSAPPPARSRPGESAPRGVPGRTTPGRTTPDKPSGPALPRVHPIEAWLRIHGVEDKDARRETDLPAHIHGERRRRLLRKRPDAVIDLHGLTRNEAWEALERFFEESRRQGLEKLTIIHGKGNHSAGDAVLKATVRGFIEQCPFAGESGTFDKTAKTAKTGAGRSRTHRAGNPGSGATWVLLKPAYPD